MLVQLFSALLKLGHSVIAALTRQHASTKHRIWGRGGEEFQRTGDVFDELSNGRVIGQGGAGSLHVGQLRHKLFNLSNCLRIVTFLRQNKAYIKK